VNDSLPPDPTEMGQKIKEPSADDLKMQIQVKLGQQLHTARERKEIAITEASSTLRISKAYLEGLENGDWSKLPEEVYVIGFLRQYATFLGEDFHEEIETLKSGSYRLTKPFTIPDPPIVPNKVWAMAAGILFALLFILFNAVENGEDKIPLPEAPVADTSPAPAKETAEKQPVVEKSVEKNISSAVTPPLTPSTVAGESPPNDNIGMSSQTVEEAPSSATAEKTLKMHRYRLTAIDASAWLQVHDPSGALLKEALLHPGQTLRMESSAAFLSVTCGNAAALQIEVDDTLYAAAGTLGAPEKVLHDFRIEVQDRNTD